jgi:hypothetical protein
LLQFLLNRHYYSHCHERGKGKAMQRTRRKELIL